MWVVGVVFGGGGWVGWCLVVVGGLGVVLWWWVCGVVFGGVGVWGCVRCGEKIFSIRDRTVDLAVNSRTL